MRAVLYDLRFAKVKRWHGRPATILSKKPVPFCDQDWKRRQGGCQSSAHGAF
ncbi:MAG: hypothetical protein QOE96_3945, partial [Blastocatellia bacterium]|nr:hypothetical protein [Blastocatellia bacterium]